jgi:hypothetical protein
MGLTQLKTVSNFSDQEASEYYRLQTKFTRIHYKGSLSYQKVLDKFSTDNWTRK